MIISGIILNYFDNSVLFILVLLFGSNEMLRNMKTCFPCFCVSVKIETSIGDNMVVMLITIIAIKG